MRAVRFGCSDHSGRVPQILKALTEGLSVKEIAARRTVSIATGRTHVNAILAKTGARSCTQALILAFRHSLVQIEMSAALWPEDRFRPQGERRTDLVQPIPEPQPVIRITGALLFEVARCESLGVGRAQPSNQTVPIAVLLFRRGSMMAADGGRSQVAPGTRS